MNEYTVAPRASLLGLVAVGLVAALTAVSHADSLAGLPDMTAADDAITSLTYDGQQFVVADGDLMLGETTRWWVDPTGNEIFWDPADPATDPPQSPAPVAGTSDAEVGELAAGAATFCCGLME